MEILTVTECSSDNDGSIHIFDLPGGNIVYSLKTGASVPQTLSLLGNSFLVLATRNKPVLNVFGLNRHYALSQKVVAPGVVNVLCCRPDGFQIFAGIGDKIFVWNARSGELDSVLAGHYQDVTILTTTSDSNMLISSGLDGVVAVWDLLDLDELNSSQASAKPQNFWAAHMQPVTGVACSALSFRETRIYSASLDKTVKVHDCDLDQLLLVVAFHTKLYSLALDLTEALICVGGGDGKVYSIDLISTAINKTRCTDEDSKAMYTTFCSGHLAPVTFLQFTLDCSILVSCAETESVKLWDSKSGDCLKSVLTSKHEKQTFCGLLLAPYPSNLSQPNWEPAFPFPKLAHSMALPRQNRSDAVSIRLGILGCTHNELPNPGDALNKALFAHQSRNNGKDQDLKQKLVSAVEENKKLCEFVLDQILSWWKFIAFGIELETYCWPEIRHLCHSCQTNLCLILWKKLS